MPAIEALLASFHLPTTDLPVSLDHFYVGLDKHEIVAVAGLEIYQYCGLLRSVAVKIDYRNSGIASLLVNTLLTYAKKHRITKVYLITETAEDFFVKRGFSRVPRNDVSPEVLVSREFNGLCPSSATILQQNC